ncbi:MAG: hypothetical protein IJV11_08875 [Muribaculaceae bacterium]|nr:hypothetical protein [Muribaculaceae bacterium]
MIQVKKTDDMKATGAADVEAWTIGDVYQNREMVLAHPERFGRIVTKFVAGGLGACAYKRDVSISQLTQCWQRTEYRCKCPECGHEAYIYYFAGHVNGGGYWEIYLYCPECDCGYSSRFPQRLSHWTVLKDIFKETAQKTDSNTSK